MPIPLFLLDRIKGEDHRRPGPDPVEVAPPQPAPVPERRPAPRKRAAAPPP